MKKSWNRFWLITLMLSLLLTGNMGNAAMAQVPFQISGIGKTTANVLTVEKTKTEAAASTEAPEETEEPYESISLVQIADYSATSLTLSWFSDGNNDGFIIYRKCKYDTDFKKLGTVANEPFTTHTFQDTQFKRGIKFQYKIVAYRQDEQGQITEGISEQKSIKIAIPKTTLSSVSRSGKKATLKWKKVSGVDGYEICQKNSGGTYHKVKTVKSGSTVKGTVTKLSTQKTISFKVRAFVKYSGNYVYGSYGAAKSVFSVSKQKIIQMFKKLQKLYPDGRYWNHVGKKKYNSSTTTNKPCQHTSPDDLSTCNHYNCPNGVLGFQCYGFAWKMSDLIYGRNAKIRNFNSFSKCQMGDVIRYSGHSVIITEKHKNYVVVGECNYGNTCIIKWGRKVYKAELNGATYSRRYR